MYGNGLHVINKFYELFPLGFIEYVYFMPKECTNVDESYRRFELYCASITCFL